MKLYGECCPHCGTWNDNLYLDETDGYYECEKCGEVVRSKTHGVDLSSLPLFDLGDPIDQLRLIDFCTKKEMPEFKFRKIAKAN